MANEDTGLEDGTLYATVSYGKHAAQRRSRFDYVLVLEEDGEFTPAQILLILAHGKLNDPVYYIQWMQKSRDIRISARSYLSMNMNGHIVTLMLAGGPFLTISLFHTNQLLVHH